MSALSTHKLTDAERAAVADVARCGVWVPDVDWEPVGYCHRFTQHETDVLIANELSKSIPSVHDDSDFWVVLGTPHAIEFPTGAINPEFQRAEAQRGGLHTDWRIRLLAFRIWGQRDREWFLAPGDRVAWSAGAGYVSVATAARALVVPDLQPGSVEVAPTWLMRTQLRLITSRE